MMYWKRINWSKWGSPLQIIPKQDRSFWFMTDFGELINWLVHITYQLSLKCYWYYDDWFIVHHKILTWDTLMYCSMMRQNISTTALQWGKYNYLWLSMGISCSQDIFQERISHFMQHLVQLWIFEIISTDKNWCYNNKHNYRTVFECLCMANLCEIAKSTILSMVLNAYNTKLVDILWHLYQLK